PPVNAELSASGMERARPRVAIGSELGFEELGRPRNWGSRSFVSRASFRIGGKCRPAMAPASPYLRALSPHSRTRSQNLRAPGSQTFVGIDENGLGPRLGPLVVTAASAFVPDPEGAKRTLGKPRGKLKERLGDSKELVAFGDSKLGEAWA